MTANRELLSDRWGVWVYDARKASETPDVGQIFSVCQESIRNVTQEDDY